jgi:carbonic anhydrase
MSDLTADEALAQLQAGNLRFQEDPRAENWTFEGPHPSVLADGQRPFAAVLGCADSRVPVEVVFGQGPGQLFVVRVAGNIAASSQLGSLEFAVAVLGVRLVVVLGHTRCGLVDAALHPPETPLPAHLSTLARRVAGALGDDHGDGDAATRLDRAVRANVRLTHREILEGSAVIGGRAATGGVRVVGAVYDLASGAVEWLDKDGTDPGGP